MKKLLLIIIILLSSPLAVLAMTPQEFPETEAPAQCVTLVKECFAHADLDRANCFFSSASHPFCKGTKLGKIAMRRFEIAPNRPSGSENAPGFLGPQLVNVTCLKSFDSQLSSQLMQRNFSHGSLSGLLKTLNSCNRNVEIDLTRP